MLVGVTKTLAASAGSLTALQNLAVPLTASGVAGLGRLGERFPKLRSLGIILSECALIPRGLARRLRTVPSVCRISIDHMAFSDSQRQESACPQLPPSDPTGKRPLGRCGARSV